MKNMTLGLDLGTNSIGWALIGHGKEQDPQKLVACGVRIFQEVVDDKTRVPKTKLVERQGPLESYLPAGRCEKRSSLIY